MRNKLVQGPYIILDLSQCESLRFSEKSLILRDLTDSGLEMYVRRNM